MCNHSKPRGSKARPIHNPDCSDECAGARAGFPLRSALGLTAIEDITLDMVRLILSSHVSGESRFWDTAMDFAEVNLGALPGTTLLVHVAAVVRMVRRERQVPFSFLSFGCRHVSDDEAALIGLLQAVQMGTQDDVNDTLEQLAQGGPVQGMRSAAVILAERMRVIEASVVHPDFTRAPVAAVRERSLH